MRLLVSVVIPTYNHAHFLGRALQSILDQTYPYWEALVVDNHSQDNTDEIIKSFDDHRIRSFKIHNNGVIAASRNLGMREARGEWIAFLDSDDCWYPKKLETIMNIVENDDAYDVLSNDELMVDIKISDKRILRYGPYQKDFYQVLLVEGNRLSTSATIIRREFIARHGLAFDESQDYVTVEDYDLWLNLARTGARFKFINEVLGEYLVHGANSSAQLSRHRRNGEVLLRTHVFKIQKFQPVPARLWKKIVPRLHLGQVRQLVAERHFWLALKLTLETLCCSPIDTIMHLFSKFKIHYKHKGS